MPESKKIFWYIRYTIQVVNKVKQIKDLKALNLRGPTQENLLPHPLAVPSLDNGLCLRILITIKHVRGFLTSPILNWQLISWNSKAKFCKHHFCCKNLVAKTAPLGVGVGVGVEQSFCIIWLLRCHLQNWPQLQLVT